MFKNKCPNCAEKIEKKFRFCPYCAFPVAKQREEEDFGMFGKDDFLADLRDMNSVKMPMGFDKILNSLMKQIAPELKGMPGGFKIQISRGNPQQPKQEMQQNQKAEKVDLSEKEIGRRVSLPRVEAASNVRRFSDKIVFEINMPGVKSKEDIAISKLENSLEIKAYSKEYCYIKTLPLKTDISKYSLKDGVLSLEFKS